MGLEVAAPLDPGAVHAQLGAPDGALHAERGKRGAAT